MSARTDLVRQALSGEFDPQQVLDGSTPDATLYAPGLGAEVKGAQAIADVLATFFAVSKPTYRLEIDPVEQGEFVVAFRGHGRWRRDGAAVQRVSLRRRQDRRLLGHPRLIVETGAWPPTADLLEQ